MSDNRNLEGADTMVPFHVRLKSAGIAILIAGLLGAGLIYFNANDASASAIGYEIEGGTAYPVTQGEYKRSQFELEKVGGKFSVVATQLDEWFSGLWHGRQLGITLAILAVCSSIACLFFAHVLSFQPRSEETQDNRI